MKNILKYSTPTQNRTMKGKDSGMNCNPRSLSPSLSPSTQRPTTAYYKGECDCRRGASKADKSGEIFRSLSFLSFGLSASKMPSSVRDGARETTQREAHGKRRTEKGRGEREGGREGMFGASALYLWRHPPLRPTSASKSPSTFGPPPPQSGHPSVSPSASSVSYPAA